MSNIDKHALTAESARESGNILLIVASRMARRELFTPLHMLCELPQRVVSIRTLREALERSEETLQREVCKIVDGHDRMQRKLKEAEEKLEAAEKRIAELSSAVIAPGVMRCAGCGFVLTKNSINMAVGTITAGDSKTEPCPNGCGSLWPVTWKEQAIEMRDSSEQWFEELQEARQRIAELSHHLQCAHALIEHTEAFGHAASNGILCCGDAQWNIDESKSALAAAGKGE